MIGTTAFNLKTAAASAAPLRPPRETKTGQNLNHHLYFYHTFNFESLK
jgi:hypothetical protein